jgi:ankyrin repeat protein
LHMLLIARVANKEAARAIIQILKKAGADVNAKDDWGWTPLSYANYYKSD